MKKKQTYTVYCIKHDDKIIYCGRTTSIRTRQNTHNRDLMNGKNKILYNYLRNMKVSHIELIPFFIYDDKVKSKRMEMYQILKSYIEGGMKQTLLQRIPNISDKIN